MCFCTTLSIHSFFYANCIYEWYSMKGAVNSYESLPYNTLYVNSFPYMCCLNVKVFSSGFEKLHKELNLVISSCFKFRLSRHRRSYSYQHFRMVNRDTSIAYCVQIKMCEIPFSHLWYEWLNNVTRRYKWLINAVLTMMIQQTCVLPFHYIPHSTICSDVMWNVQRTSLERLKGLERLLYLPTRFWLELVYFWLSKSVNFAHRYQYNKKHTKTCSIWIKIEKWHYRNRGGK